MGFLNRLVVFVGAGAALFGGWYLVFFVQGVLHVALSIALVVFLLPLTIVWLTFGWDYLFDASLSDRPKPPPPPTCVRPVWDEEKKKWVP